MLFNIVKCHHLHIGKHDSDTTYTMKSKGQEIELEKVRNDEDLGVIIDQKLTFRDHITAKVNIANRNLGIILRIYTYIDEGPQGEVLLNFILQDSLRYSVS